MLIVGVLSILFKIAKTLTVPVLPLEGSFLPFLKEFCLFSQIILACKSVLTKVESCFYEIFVDLCVLASSNLGSKLLKIRALTFRFVTGYISVVFHLRQLHSNLPPNKLQKNFVDDSSEDSPRDNSTPMWGNGSKDLEELSKGRQ